LDINSAPAVTAWLTSAAVGHPAGAIVNLARVAFLDSSALGALVRARKAFRETGGDLYLCGLQRAVRVIFELTTLDRVFQIFVDEEEAVRGFGG
jgi:anti-sigma B factor antagonist